jgi:hypothetical protein
MDIDGMGVAISVKVGDINVEVGEMTVGVGSCSTFVGCTVGAAGPHPARVKVMIRKIQNQDIGFIIGLFLIN